MRHKIDWLIHWLICWWGQLDTSSCTSSHEANYSECPVYWLCHIICTIFSPLPVYAPSQWKMMLHCNVVSHWLGTYTKWSLHIHQEVHQWMAHKMECIYKPFPPAGFSSSKSPLICDCVAFIRPWVTTSCWGHGTLWAWGRLGGGRQAASSQIRGSGLYMIIYGSTWWLQMAWHHQVPGHQQHLGCPL